MKKWRCRVCQYVHRGDAPPEKCPVCGAGAEAFELIEDEDAPSGAAAGGGGTAAATDELKTLEEARDRARDNSCPSAYQQRFAASISRFLSG